jgi:hypothetical protein
MIVIKMQVWRGGKLISEDVCPVYPGTEFSRSFGSLGLQPIVDGNVALKGFSLKTDAEFLDKSLKA